MSVQDRIRPAQTESTLRAALCLPGGKLFRLGRTARQKSIWAFLAGNPENPVCYIGGVHGQEGITTLLLLRWLTKMAESYTHHQDLYGIHPENYWRSTGVLLIPCLNPDMVTLQKTGWQANANGVDLNHNFDSGWADCQKKERAMGITGPGPTRYGGKHPFSEPESKAIRRLCGRRKIAKLITFHSQGEEIYAGHGADCDPATEAMAKIMAQLTGYRLCQPEDAAADGGLKDWFYDVYRKPAFTVEIGKGENPLPAEDLPELYSRLEKLLTLFPLL